MVAVMNDKLNAIVACIWNEAERKARLFAESNGTTNNLYMQDLAWLGGVYDALDLSGLITAEQYSYFIIKSSLIIKLAWSF